MRSFKPAPRVVLVLTALGVVAGASFSVASETPSPASQSSEIALEDLREDVYYLASPALGGRLTGSDGEALAARFIASVYQEAGLIPFGGREDYFSKFPFTAGVKLGERNQMRVQQPKDSVELELNRDFRPLSFSQTGMIPSAPVVFAGYGMVAPASAEFPEYNSFKGLDVSGKWVVVLRFLPERVSPKHRQYLYPYADLKRKAFELRGLGAKGMIIVSGPNAIVKDELVPLTFDAAMSGMSIAAVSVTNAVGETLVASSGKSLRELQEALDDGSAVPGVALPAVSVDAAFEILQEQKTGTNVVARLRCGAPDGAPVMFLGSHFDHLGPMDPDHPEVDIRVGADDNASGTAANLEIAQHLGRRCRSGELTLSKDIVFAAWSGEELGMLGSTHFAEALAGGVAGTLYPRVAAYLNMDMVGRLTNSLAIQGAGSSSIWRPLTEKLSASLNLPVLVQDDPYLPTDSTAFYLKGVPTLAAFTGSHDDYHTPADTPDKINYEGVQRVAALMEQVLLSVASTSDVPDFKQVPRPPSGTGFGVYLGTVPDMTHTDVKGVLLSGVRVNSPADRAGLKAGDTIVELAGMKIENLYDYRNALTALRIGEKVPIVVEREGQRLVFPIVPEPRQ